MAIEYVSRLAFHHQCYVHQTKQDQGEREEDVYRLYRDNQLGRLRIDIGIPLPILRYIKMPDVETNGSYASCYD